MRKEPKHHSGRAALIVTAVALAVSCAVGSTVAWLSDSHKLKTVVFANSDIKIEFKDTSSADTVKLVPGHTVDKSPMVTVKADSEKCYLFVKVEKNMGSGASLSEYEFEDYVTYKIIGPDKGGWTQLRDSDGNVIEDVYYRVTEQSDTDQTYRILDGGTFRMGTTLYTWDMNQILINPEMTLEMQDGLTEDNAPELSFSAYAIQYFKSNDVPFEAYEAWAAVGS